MTLHGSLASADYSITRRSAPIIRIAPPPRSSRMFRRSFLSPHVVFVAALFVIAFPYFFDAYRISVFGVISYDDYAPYLLWLLGEPGGHLPGSPHGYRLGSVVLAAPFYYLPTIPLNGLSEDAAYQRATQAICLANVFYVCASAVILYAYLNVRRRLRLEVCLLSGVLLVLLSKYMSLVSVDGIATLPVLILVLSVIERRVRLFAFVAISSAMVNEKIVLVALMLSVSRAIFSRNHRACYLRMSVFGFLALLCSITIVVWFDLPGHGHQRNPSMYYDSFVQMIPRMLTAKGLYLNMWPLALMCGLWWLGISNGGGEENPSARSDILVALGLCAVSLLVKADYNVGRIVMYSLPLYIVGAVEGASSLLSRRGRRLPMTEFGR